ncbi:MAG: HAMP domain-containing sensor histidine kinase [Bacteroidia bacterium]
MKLYSKFALFNAASKVLIIAAFILFVPTLIHEATLIHTDYRLKNMKDQVLKIIHKVGLKHFIEEEPDSSFASYNILKEEYISIVPTTKFLPNIKIENSLRSIDNEVVDYRVLDYTFADNNQVFLLEIGRSLSTVEDFESTLKKIAFYVLILVLSVTIVVDIGFSKYLLRPFNRIIQDKLITAKHPDTFNYASIPTSTTDFRYLDDTITNMMKKINDAFLIEKEFIANVSHELLTPISILQSRLENMLADHELSEESALKIIESQKTLNRLNKIIKTLLLISKIENDQYLKNHTVTVKSLVADVIMEIEERLTEKKIELSVAIENDFTIENCNKPLLFILLFNIINNAIKYNKKRGWIKISEKENNEFYTIEVQDNGVGIEPENIPFIFDRFKKFNKTETESYGLGLPIVKTIANFHTIAVEVSSKIGEGSIFKIVFKKK